jgi:DNA-binding FadR family transcriptional regulator
VRSALEVAAAGLAAERATADDLAGLETALDRMKASLADVEAAAQADLEFHRAIAAATHNELFPLLLDSIAEALVAVRREALAAGPKEPERTLKEHRRIRKAVAAHDRDAAEGAMREHLHRVAARRGAA